jgi:RNA polymerase-binding transcription factor DksA
MNVMMMALLQDRLWQMGASLERRLDLMRSCEDSVANARESGLRLESMQPEAAQAELAQVLHALELFDEGRYGMCDVCRDRIEPDDLLVRPHRLVCLRCQRSAQQRQKSTGDVVDTGIGLPVHPQGCMERVPAFVASRL